MRGERYLVKPKQYTRVYDQGTSWTDGLLVMKASPNQLVLSRYGISVSKRVGNAVVRNRVKRLLRETLRRQRIKPGWDIIFIARPMAGSTDYASLERTISDLLSRAQLLVREDERVCLRTD